jgi:hypothetical protein
VRSAGSSGDVSLTDAGQAQTNRLRLPCGIGFWPGPTTATRNPAKARARQQPELKLPCGLVLAVLQLLITSNQEGLNEQQENLPRYDLLQQAFLDANASALT